MQAFQSGRTTTMSSPWIHPALVLLAGCAGLPLVPRKLKKAFLLVVPALAYGLVLTMSRGEYAHVRFLQWTLTFGRVDGLSLVFAHIMSLMSIIGTLYGLHVDED